MWALKPLGGSEAATLWKTALDDSEGPRGARRTRTRTRTREALGDAAPWKRAEEQTEFMKLMHMRF